MSTGAKFTGWQFPDSGSSEKKKRNPTRKYTGYAADREYVVSGIHSLGFEYAALSWRPGNQSSDSPGEGDGLTEEERKQVQELQRRDREVRAHEQAHLAAAGGHALGGASYSYQAGPDGRRYAVGGEVSIDTSPVRDDPRATIAKAQTIRAAALAPADPSGADRAVAAAAAKMEADAQRELAEAGETPEARENPPRGTPGATGTPEKRGTAPRNGRAGHVDTYA